jgi:hypothetical protein
MKTKNARIDIKSLLIGALVGASIMLSVAAGTTSSNHTTWEYKVVRFSGQSPEEQFLSPDDSATGQELGHSEITPWQNGQSDVALRLAK